MAEYFISMEVEGPLAMWSRPDTGSSPTSYPIPTWSATKGIFESIVFFPDGKAWINPFRVEICKHKNSKLGGSVHYQKLTSNYRGPLRERGKSNYQFSALVLADVCYRVHAKVENGMSQPLRRGNNPCHYLTDKFNHRLKRGQCLRTPTLGWSEFVPSYWGSVRNENSDCETITEVDVEISLNVVSILKEVFDKPTFGKYNPSFVQGENAWIRKGVFNYAE